MIRRSIELNGWLFDQKQQTSSSVIKFRTVTVWHGILIQPSMIIFLLNMIRYLNVLECQLSISGKCRINFQKWNEDLRCYVLKPKSVLLDLRD